MRLPGKKKKKTEMPVLEAQARLVHLRNAQVSSNSYMVQCRRREGSRRHAGFICCHKSCFLLDSPEEAAKHVAKCGTQKDI